MNHQAESLNHRPSNKVGLFDLNHHTSEQARSSNGSGRRSPQRAAGGVFRKRRLLPISVLEGLVAAALLAQGFAKLFGSPALSPLFGPDGIGLWLRYLVGMVEIALAILLLNPRPRFLASSVTRIPARRSSSPRGSDDDIKPRPSLEGSSHVF